MKADLSKSDLIAILDIITTSVSCQSSEEYNELIEKAQSLLSFNHDGCPSGGFGNTREKHPMEKAALAGSKVKEACLYNMNGQRSSACAILSLCGQMYANSERSKIILDYLAPHLRLAYKRTQLNQKEAPVQLSPRECEVLSWTAAGKTAWETSVILDISRRTVEFHMGNILNKLDAVNSQHAIAIALSCGMIE